MRTEFNPIEQNFIIDYLIEHRDLKYKEFQCSIIPNIDPSTVIGVRMPELHKFASKLMSIGYDKKFLKNLPHKYHEENVLHALFINEMPYARLAFPELDTFLPYVDNWAVCDSFTPRSVKRNPNLSLAYIDKCLKSTHIYTQRFALVMLLRYYIPDDTRYNPEILERAHAVSGDDYYLKMAVAWFYATALCYRLDDALLYLKNGCLDREIHSMTIKKACESNMLSKQQKEFIKTFK